MKGQVAASAVAIASLAREGFEPGGDLIFAACADEEVGTGFGLQWLCEEHPEAVRSEYCVNEGAGDRLVLGGRVFYVCSTAEKMSSPFRIRVHGRSGHASRPAIADNALVKAAPLIELLGRFQDTPELGPEVEAFLRAVTRRGAGSGPRRGGRPRGAPARRRPHRAAARDDRLADADRRLARSQRDPGAAARSRWTAESFPSAPRRRWRRSSGSSSATPTSTSSGSRATAGRARRSTRRSGTSIEAFVADTEPGAQVVPLLLAGFTDSHWLRDAFGTVAYGFFPMRTMEPELAARLIHSADERIEVEDLELGVRFLRHAAVEVGSLPSTA